MHLVDENVGLQIGTTGEATVATSIVSVSETTVGHRTQSLVRQLTGDTDGFNEDDGAGDGNSLG